MNWKDQADGHAEKQEQEQNTAPCDIDRRYERGQDAFCLVCSHIITERSCKRRCPRCGFMEDCSDGML